MEVVIPPRDHKPSTYRYTWDDNGEVSQIQRVNPGEHQRNRSTVQWPFQDMLESESGGTRPSTSYGTTIGGGGRRATWQPAGLTRGVSDASSWFNPREIVPDYVVNYLRGETPETLARKKNQESNYPRRGEQDVDMEHASERLRSRAAEQENWFHSETSMHSASSGPSSQRSLNERSQILPHGRGGRDGEKGGERGWRKLLIGWRGGVVLNAIISFLILLVTFVCLILAVTKSTVLAGGESTIYTGSCGKAKDIEWGLFALINFFTMVLIAGANYVFQVMSSPTRVEVAVAHSTRRFLDIGVPSLRNLRHISARRVLVILAVLVSAVITQIIYNSVIFISQTAVAHDILFVTQSFLSGAQISNGTANNNAGLSRIQIQDLQARAARDELTNLTVPACLDTFTTAFQTDYDAVILVTDLASASSSLIQTAAPGSSLAQFQPDGGRGLGIQDHQVQYCLAQPSPPPACAVSLNGSLIGITALLNLLTLAAVALSLTCSSFDPLVTLGDAVSSFLTDPDPSTKGNCLMSKSDAYRGRWGAGGGGEAKYWVPGSHGKGYWFSLPGAPVWFAAGLMYAVLFSLAAAGLGVDVGTAGGGRLSPFGEGRAESVMILPGGGRAAGGAGPAVLAALPHLGLGVLYFAVNSLLSSYFLGDEFSRFAVRHTTLRVSSGPLPWRSGVSGQSTSLYLTLPRPYSWALFWLFVGMGFVLSQSVFVVRVSFVASGSAGFAAGILDAAGPEKVRRMLMVAEQGKAAAAAAAAASPSPFSGVETISELTAIGISGTGLLVFLVLLAALAALVVNLGFRRPASPGLDPVTGTPAPNPLALKGGSCSAVIAARCQHDVSEHYLASWPGGIKWGVLRGAEGMNVGHCGFSARRVGVLEGGKSYS